MRAGRSELGLFVHTHLDVALMLGLREIGLDYICFDLQHGRAGTEDLTAAAIVLRDGGPRVLARVADNSVEHIGRALDAGAQGVIVPLVDTPGQAEAAVRACRYAPAGHRSFGPFPAAAVHGAAHASVAAAIECYAMIETSAGLANVEAIASVPGLSGLYIGPADLSLALGLAPRLDHDEAEFGDAVARIVAAARAAATKVGVHSGPAAAARRVEQRFDLVTIGSDASAFTAGVQSHVAIAAGTVS